MVQRYNAREAVTRYSVKEAVTLLHHIKVKSVCVAMGPDV